MTHTHTRTHTHTHTHTHVLFKICDFYRCLDCKINAIGCRFKSKPLRDL